MSRKPILRTRRFSAIQEEWIRRRCTRRVAADPEVEAYVGRIVEDVRRRGDEALIEYTKRFDGVDLREVDLRVSQREVKEAYGGVGEDEVDALRRLRRRIARIEGQKLKLLNYELDEDGLRVSLTTRPIPSVGCYVPGGRAAYPSTLLMTVVPSKVAGVPRIVVCSPPTHDGEVNPLILVAADVCGVDEVYRVGGPQAVAAMAYGTESVKPVAKVVGPGREYVTAAKIAVSRDVAIDLPAGPSEVVVLADETADPRLVALDLISQSEHAPDYVAGLVTVSEDLASRVVAQIEELIPGLARKETVVNALSQNGFVLLCDTVDEAVDFVNAFAPEHLEIITRRPREIAERITSAGIVLLGPYTPVSASDYAIGTNHVLPTGGFGHVYSGLSVLDYVRRINVVECSREKLRTMRGAVRVLSESEGLPNHFLALEGRLKDG